MAFIWPKRVAMFIKKIVCFDGDFRSIVKHNKRTIKKIKTLGTHFLYRSLRTAAMIEVIKFPKLGN